MTNNLKSNVNTLEDALKSGDLKKVQALIYSKAKDRTKTLDRVFHAVKVAAKHKQLKVLTYLLETQTDLSDLSNRWDIASMLSLIVSIGVEFSKVSYFDGLVYISNILSKNIPCIKHVWSRLICKSDHFSVYKYIKNKLFELFDSDDSNELLKIFAEGFLDAIQYSTNFDIIEDLHKESGNEVHTKILGFHIWNFIYEKKNYLNPEAPKYNRCRIKFLLDHYLFSQSDLNNALWHAKKMKRSNYVALFTKLSKEAGDREETIRK